MKIARKSCGIRVGVIVATLLFVTATSQVASSEVAPSQTVFPSREDALARPSLVVESGTFTSQYRVGSPPPDTTYDLRGVTSTVYPYISRYPLSFGKAVAGIRTVVVGGTVLGAAPLTATWQEVKDAYDGTALLMFGEDQIVSYDLRADDVFDMFRPRTPGDLNAASFLLEGCYGTNIRDDAVENDHEISGTIRDCVFDGINSGVSIGQNATNPSAVTTIENSTFIFRAMPNENALDGAGHAVLFKQMGAGQVAVRNVVVCYEETPIGPQRLENWMPGTYEDVSIVLGPGFDGDGDGDVTDLDHPGTLPPGVTQTRDTSLCVPSVPAPIPLALTGIAPVAGPVGTPVTLTGSGFWDVSDVSFNGAPATFTVDSPGQITATVPLDATDGPITVTDPSGVVTSETAFDVAPPPVPAIASFDPPTAAVGSAVIITGSGFTGATSVTFNGVPAAFAVDADTQITTVVPDGAADGPIQVSGLGGIATSATAFDVTPLPVPVIDSFAPAIGSIGSSIVITGTEFTGATSVTFNGVAAAFTLDSDTQITAVVPEGAMTGPVWVSAPGGLAQSTSGFTVTETLTFAPAADTFVAAAYPKKNYGTTSTLQLGQKPLKDLLLDFAISGVGTRTVISAKLRLYSLRSSTSGGIFYPTDAAWTETGVMWPTAPSRGLYAVASLGSVAANTWYEVDLTSFIQGDAAYALRVVSESTTEAQYVSKEGKAAFRPHLVVTVG